MSRGAGCLTETALDSSGALAYGATGERPVLESDATDKEPQAPLAEAPWHDKILGDAIGYTKGLVTILDSLSEGFRRRGQELEELRHRLAILQSERRALQEERAGLEAQIGTRTAECEALRQELTQGRTAVEARAQEIQALNVACEDAKRQAEELREIVRSLERQLGQGRPSTVQHLPGPRPPMGAAPVDLPGASRREGAEPSQPLLAVARPAELQLHSLTTERDRLQAELEKRDQELDRLRQELAQGQASLEARVRELQEHQRAAAEASREKQHLQEVVRGLEREKESAAQRHAARITEFEGELARMREAAARASQDQAAVREEVAAAESRLTAPEPRQAETRPQPAPIATPKAPPPSPARRQLQRYRSIAIPTPA